MTDIKLALKMLLPAFLYALGIISFFLSDLIVSSSFEPDTVVSWANTKSFMMILSPLMLLGLSNLYVRWPECVGGVTLSVVFVLFLTSCGLVIIKKMNPDLYPIWYIDVCVGYCIIVCGMSYLRGRFKIFKAQVHQNAWKVLLFFIVATYFLSGIEGDVKTWYRSAIWGGVGLLSITFILLMTPLSINVLRFRFLSKSKYLFSIQMMLSTATMAISAYASVYLVSAYAETYTSASFFSHYVIFTSFAVIFSGYIGFVLTPAVKKMPEKYIPLLTSNKKIVLFGSFFTVILNIFVGYLSFNFLYGDKYPIDYVWVILISTECVMRILYVFPTSILGAFADGKKLTGFVISGSIGCLMIIGFAYLGFRSEEFVNIILFGVLLNWMLRLTSALWIAKNIIREKFYFV